MKRLLYITASLSALALLFVVAHAVGNQPVNYQTQTAIASVQYPSVSQVADLINVERDKVGLPRLVENAKLDITATEKCQSMVNENYFAHVDPATGLHSWHYIDDQSVSYKYAGENLAAGYKDSVSLVNGWMSSPEHRKNILDPTYSSVGYAECFSKTNGYMVVQHFIGN